MLKMLLNVNYISLILFLLVSLLRESSSFLPRRTALPTLPLSPPILEESSKRQEIESSHIHSRIYTSSIKQGETDLIDEKAIWVSRATLLTVSAFYGTNFGCVKILGEALDPSLAAALRFSLAALVFSPFLIKFGKVNKKFVVGGLEVGAYNAIGYWAQAQSLLTSHASTTSFICSLAVIVVPILDVLFGERKSGRPWWEPLLPATLAAAGVACLELGGTEVPGIGDLWAFAQPICFGLSFWRVEHHMGQSKGGDGEAQSFTGAMMLSVAAFSCVWASHDFLAPLIGHQDAFQAAVATQLGAFSDWRVLAAILWTGIVTTALTSYGENIAMKSLSAAESTVIYSTEPLWGAAFAAFALGETLTWSTFAGAALILCACIWSSLGPTVPAIASALLPLEGEVEEGIAEMLENVNNNWNSLLNNIPDVPPPTEI